MRDVRPTELPLPPQPGPPFEPVPPPVRRAHSIGQGALALVGLGAGLVALRAISVHAPPCPFRAVTGVPCPGCGMTRVASAVAHGHIGTAVRADVAGVVILGALLLLALVHLVRVVVQRREPARWMRTWAVPAMLVALVAAHWVTTIVTGGLPSGS